MVSQATIQAKVNFGFGKAAQKTAVNYGVYRSTGVATPIIPANLITTLPVGIDTNAQFTFMQPGKILSDMYVGMLDLTLIENGDYLVGPQGVFFTSQIAPFKPPVLVQCPHTISLERQDDTDKQGLQIRPTYDPEQSSWVGVSNYVPASMLPDRERGKPPADFPGDVITKTMWKVLLSPAFGSATSANWNDIIRPGDKMRNDATNQMFRVSTVEWHPSAWMLKCELLSPSAG